MNVLPSVAVVILNWNGKKFLEQFLPSVLQSDFENLSIVVADNCSTDDSVSFLQSQYPQIRIIQNTSNQGFAKGYNSALMQIKADYYILLNSDVEVTPNWIAPIILRMENDKSIAACQPKILSYADRSQFEYAGASGGYIDTLGYPFSRGRVFEYCETDLGQYNDAIEIFWATGACLFVRSNIYHQLNGFDEYFFAHQEEIDLCWRMKRAGYTIFVEPAATVYHVGGGTLPMGSQRKVYLNFRNNLIMLAKNLPSGEAIFKIPFRIFLDWITSVRSLLQRDAGTFLAIWKAHAGFFNWFFIKKHKDTLPKIKLKKLSGVYLGSVVKAYFIDKKNTFIKIVCK